MRTDEDKVLQSPLTVVFGGTEYSVPLLPIKEAREWRKQLSALVGKMPSYAMVTTDTPDEFEGAINAILSATPDAVADLFFAYAKGLDRETIEATANEVELGKAFEAVIEVAFPLVQSLTGAMGRLAR